MHKKLWCGQVVYLLVMIPRYSSFSQKRRLETTCCFISTSSRASEVTNTNTNREIESPGKTSREKEIRESVKTS